MLSSLSLGCGGSKDAIVIRSMPPGGSFTGVWFSPQYGEMHILQSGASAIGRYTKDERLGKIQGGIEGDIMRFEWSERREMIVGRPVQTRGHGYFRLVKDDAEDTWKLVGEWGNDANERGGGPWNAVKSKTRRPDVDGSGKSERDADEVSPSSGDEADDGPDDLSDL
ncbi:MAG: hypothetical protein ABW252_10795 [Polyangiales bacterium]